MTRQPSTREPRTVAAESAPAGSLDVFPSDSLPGLVMEIAASGVVHEAEPPGIDYVTIQVDSSTWEAVKHADRLIRGER